MSEVTVSDAHKTWISGAGNKPSEYIDGAKRSQFLVELVTAQVSKDATILEIGSNVGRNLRALYLSGFRNITGVEINVDAVEMGIDHFGTHGTVYIGAIEDLIDGLPMHDLIFTMAVLEHIHPYSAWIFKSMAVRSQSIITIEDEVAKSKWKWPRNYKEVFSAVGMTQVAENSCSHIDGLTPNFVARTFIHA